MTGSPKCACIWEDKELEKFRIVRKRVETVAEFFQAPPRAPHFAWSGYEELLCTEWVHEVEGDDPGSKMMRTILNQIRIIVLRNYTQIEQDCQPVSESTLGMLIVNLLNVLDYDEFVMDSSQRVKKRAILVHKQFPLLMGPDVISTEADVCVSDTALWLCYVLSISICRCERYTPWAQVVAVCIAAFQYNNATRAHNHEDELRVMVFPAILWKGTIPVFYLIKVTEDLANACANGNTPNNDTILYEYDPFVQYLKAHVEIGPHNSDALRRQHHSSLRAYGGLNPSMGMLSPANRYPIFEALENMKDFVPHSHSDTPIGWKRLMTASELERLKADRLYSETSLSRIRI